MEVVKQLEKSSPSPAQKKGKEFEQACLWGRYLGSEQAHEGAGKSTCYASLATWV